MTDLIEVKTADLVGEQLAWAVGKAEGLDVKLAPPIYGNPWRVFVRYTGEVTVRDARYDPQENWSLGGPLIEKHELTIEPSAWDWQRKCVLWRAQQEDENRHFEHVSPLVAAMRAATHTKLGHTVHVPKELCQ
ncbi:hypothetical protein PMI38_05121 [Pseudomonas sp. GM84]|uniref:phage protein NinX family protein n=1 Tax=Pseudomonas sp. GM84 TaxID=1144340 RepID=UPI00026F82D7|nr:phage protein NinX family protein [Pseudomonas sp. GM84]EJN32142.1 hypothetical protein PMI38_05121 [Pseudomonas sp. GM84]